jgi:hypothetical protein
MTLCVVSDVLGTGGSFERDFMDGQCIRDVSDTQRVGVMAFRRAIHERLKNAQFVDPLRRILIWTVERNFIARHCNIHCPRKLPTIYEVCSTPFHRPFLLSLP